jgi:hypothetical protein
MDLIVLLNNFFYNIIIIVTVRKGYSVYMKYGSEQEGEKNHGTNDKKSDSRIKASSN